MTLVMPKLPFSVAHPLHEILCVVWVIPEGPDVVFVLLDKGVKVVVYLHHVEDGSVKDEQRPLLHELLILLPPGDGQLT